MPQKIRVYQRWNNFSGFFGAVLGVSLLVVIGLALHSTQVHDQRNLSQLSPYSYSRVTQIPTAAQNISDAPKVYRHLGEALNEPDAVHLLDLSNNNLDKLPPEILQLRNLNILYLDNNDLTSLPSDVAKFTKLTFIDLTGNPMSRDEVEKIRRLLPKVNVLFLEPMDLPEDY